MPEVAGGAGMTAAGPTKRGLNCGETKPLTGFHRDAPSPDGHKRWCKACNNAAFQEYYQTAKLLDVSDPNLIWELYEKLPYAYRDAVIEPASPRRLVVEAASSFGWAKYAGDRGAYVTLDRYGDSAPYQDLEKAFGFTVENVVAKARELLD